MELAAGKETAHEEHTYDEAFEMSEVVQPVNIRNKNNPYEGPDNVKDSQDRYDDLHLPRSIGLKRNYTRWEKGAAVVLVVNCVVLIAVIIFQGLREGTDQSSSKVDGRWSTWGPWSECSASCGTGMASRNRSCSNPKPSNGGDHCHGETTEYRVCNTFACQDQFSSKADGGWSTWGSWSECSASCGTGMASRNRSCSNPKPSNGGDHCLGDTTEYRVCNRLACQDQKVDGGWREWELWSECSASCDTGMKSRKRVCSWPKPSIGGDYCPGGPVEYQLCNKRSCPSTGIGFSVYAPVKGTGGGSSTLKFSHVVENSGGAFNMTTGEFVCRQSGLYYFSNTVIRLSSTNQTAYCYFNKNGIPHSFVAGYADDTDTVYTSGTNAILYHLLPGQTVSLTSCVNSNYIALSSSFTGFLVHADN